MSPTRRHKTLPTPLRREAGALQFHRLSCLLAWAKDLGGGFIFLSVALAACATFHSHRNDPGIFLLPPSQAGFSASLLQKVELQRDHKSFDALAAIDITPSQTRMAILSPLGNRLLGIIWDGKHLRVDRSPGVPKNFPAALILRDMQLALWPAAAIRRALPSHCSLIDEGSVRRMLCDGKSFIQIRLGPSRLSDPIEFDNQAAGYQLTITPLQDGDAKRSPQ